MLLLLKRRGRSLLFLIARTSFSGYFIGWIFRYMSFLIPVERLIETSTVLAFHHPKPSYPIHILIVPKADIRNLLDITDEHSDLLGDIFQMAGKLVQQLGLEEHGYLLIVNGGNYQDIPQLHFHLISE